jgi:hypothetical protein
LKNKNTNIFKKAISAALASVPPTPWLLSENTLSYKKRTIMVMVETEAHIEVRSNVWFPKLFHHPIEYFRPENILKSIRVNSLSFDESSV